VKRLSASRLVELAGELSQRDREITETTGKLRLVSGKQIERLFLVSTTDPASRARLARRSLGRLVERGLLGRLERRRVGGIRAGAAGHVYYLTPRGQRLVAFWQSRGLVRPRSRYEPAATFVRHILGIAECYVRLVEADRAGTVELLEFKAEPECWQSFVGPGGSRQWVKPDAFVRLGVGEFEAHSWIELDCGTEGRGALLRKCRAYQAAYAAGITGDTFPRVVWIATTAKRAELLTEVCGSLPADAWKLFAVTTPERALALLAGGAS